MEIRIIATLLSSQLSQLGSSPERLSWLMGNLDSLISQGDLGTDPMVQGLGMVLPVLGMVTPEQLGDADELDATLEIVAGMVLALRSREASPVAVMPAGDAYSR